MLRFHFFTAKQGSWVYKDDRGPLSTVNVVIFAGGKFRENVGKTFHMGVIFTILLIFL